MATIEPLLNADVLLPVRPLGRSSTCIAFSAAVGVRL
jgi:hypothetical protein